MSFGFRDFAGVAAIVHLATACSSGQPTAEPARDKVEAPAAQPAQTTETGKLVLAFGDSLYAGYGVAPAESLPVELQAALGRAGVAATVRNGGVSGDTTATGRQRLAYTLDGLPRKPDLVLLGLGGNDMLRGLPPEQTEENLRAMLTELQRRRIPVVLTGMVAAPNLGRDYGDRFNALYPALAAEFGAGLYPFLLDGVVADPKLMLADRIHPNPQGIDRIVTKLVPLVAERLQSAD